MAGGGGLGRAWLPRIAGLPPAADPAAVELGVSVGGDGRGSLRATYTPEGPLAPALAAAAATLGEAGGAALASAGRHLLEAAVPGHATAGGFVAWLGMAVAEQHPLEVERVKLYVNAAHPAGGWGAIAAGSGWAPLAGGLGSPPAGTARLAAVAGDRAGREVRCLYAAPVPGHGQRLIAAAADWCGVPAADVLSAVRRVGLARDVWTGDLVVDLEEGAGDRRLEVHLATGLPGGPGGAVERDAALDAVGGAGTADRLLGAVGADRRWRTTGISLGFTPAGGGVERVNAYLLAPGG